MVESSYVIVGFHQLSFSSALGGSTRYSGFPTVLSFSPRLQMHPLNSLIFSLLALESTFPLILRRSILQESSAILSFGIGLQLLPFQVPGGCGSLFCFSGARKCIPIKHKKDSSGGRWRGHTYHITLWNTRNTCNVQSQCYLNWFS